MELTDADILQAMRREAELRYPHEACGFVISQGKKAKFMAGRNVSSSPQEQFVIDWRSYASAEDAGEILAIWHSHPDRDGAASEADKGGCEMSELPWLISPIARVGEEFVHGEVSRIDPSGFELPYVGRPYIFGTFDCYSLMVDYYKREFDISLDSFQNQRIPDWWHSRDLFGEYWSSQNFVLVEDGSWQEGDAMTIAMNSVVPNHIAIYVTGDIMLHHLVGRLSRKETFGPYWSSRVKHHIRHISKC